MHTVACGGIKCYVESFAAHFCCHCRSRIRLFRGGRGRVWEIRACKRLTEALQIDEGETGRVLCLSTEDISVQS